MGWYDKIQPISRYYDSLGDFDAGWSPSRSASTFFGASSYTNVDANAKFGKVLEELNRTANMLTNGKDGEAETRFVIRFAGDEKPMDGKGEMAISPDLILTESGNLRQGTAYYDALDALNGRVLLGTQIRRTAGEQEFTKFTQSKDVPAQSVYQTIQTVKAEQELRTEWTGFRPYLNSHKDLTSKKKEQVAIPANFNQDQLAPFLQVANWNLVNMDDPIQIANPEMQSVMDNFLGMVGEKFDECTAAADYLRTIFKQPEKSMDIGDGKGKSKEKKGGGSGSAGGEGSSEAQMKLEDTTPFDGEILSPQPKTSKPELSKITEGEGADVCDIDKFKIHIETDREVLENNSNLSRNTLQSRYAQFCMDNRTLIKNIERCFLFHENTPDIYSRGLSVGEIDDNNLHRLRYDREHIYERKDVNKQMEHQVGILLDQSGSMGHNRMKEARECVVALIEGLKSFPSIKRMVYGHTGQERKEDEVTMIPYLTESVNNTDVLIGAKARLQNIDSLALKFVVDQMLKVNVDGKRILLVISDGSPAGYGYGGSSAVTHFRNVCKRADKKGIKVFGIGICNAYPDSMGNALYGSGNFVVIDNTSASLKIMTNRLKRLVAAL
jgi:hypothetical protein